MECDMTPLNGRGKVALREQVTEHGAATRPPGECHQKDLRTHTPLVPKKGVHIWLKKRALKK